jgi:hypothetical protein
MNVDSMNYLTVSLLTPLARKNSERIFWNFLRATGAKKNICRVRRETFELFFISGL